MRSNKVHNLGYLIRGALFLIFLIPQWTAHGNESSTKNHHLDAAWGIEGSSHAISLTWTHLVSSHVGYGLRFSGFQGKNLIYKTARKKLIDQNQINEFKVASPQTNSLNLMVHTYGKIYQKLGLGFNLDLLGFGFGNSTTGTYRSRDPLLNGSQQSIKPSPRNLFRGGRADIGQLNSEIYLSYQLKEAWGIRGGTSHFFSDYTTANQLDHGNNRFRHIADLYFIAVTYRK